jgi:hypothetical protein
MRQSVCLTSAGAGEAVAVHRQREGQRRADAEQLELALDVIAAVAGGDGARAVGDVPPLSTSSSIVCEMPAFSSSPSGEMPPLPRRRAASAASASA